MSVDLTPKLNRHGRRTLVALERTKPERDRKEKAIEDSKEAKKTIAARVQRKQLSRQ
jgi:hypothetical protein